MYFLSLIEVSLGGYECINFLKKEKHSGQYLIEKYLVDFMTLKKYCDIVLLLYIPTHR
jgi:hypothetical protein